MREYELHRVKYSGAETFSVNISEEQVRRVKEISREYGYDVAPDVATVDSAVIIYIVTNLEKKDTRWNSTFVLE